MRRALIAVVAVPLVAAACGGSKHAPAPAANPLDAVKGAFKKTLSAGSESVALKANAQASGQTVLLGGSGAFDSGSRRGTLSIHIDAGPIAASVDEIVVGKTVYVKSPLLAGRLPSGKSWLKIDVGSAAAAAGLSIQSLLTGNPADQLKNLQYLASAKEVGNEQIGGVSTTRYHAVLDTDKLPKRARIVSAYDVWVGQDGYVHRVELTTSRPKTTVTVDLSDFGGKVSASAPPAAQVYEGRAGLLSGLGG